MGVAQGSVGPLLFSIYINGLTKLELENSFFMPMTRLLSLSHQIFDANTDLLKVFEYFKKNRLVVNVNKCNYMIISGRKKQ
jgi:hypothetical protein